MNSAVPAPVTLIPRDGSFSLASASVSGPLASFVAEALGISESPEGSIQLVLGNSPAPEGYTLEASPSGVRIEAADEAGLFYGVQTLRQLADDGAVGAVSITDFPRFAYRGAMLDVARHFFAVADVKRYIDDIALLKINHLHLHLTDDQGWRIQIASWPKLTHIGASTQVGGGGGGFYTQDDYREIVEYAASRFVTIVPEIDMPGHTNAAISAYPELGTAPVEPYEGIEVGFSSLAIGSETVYGFVEDVVGEIAALTPGPYLHLGGDESLATTDEDFLAFIARATSIASAHGKTLIGWHEMGRSRDLPAGTIGQYWNYTTPEAGHAEHVVSFVEQGGRVLMSPADVAYVDHQYVPAETTPAVEGLGLAWANGPTTIRSSYEWDPAAIIPGIEDAQIVGVEGPLWTETLGTIEQLEVMAFPRLAAVAEVAWSPRAPRDWDEFSPRLDAFRAYLDTLGIHHN